MDGGGAKMGYSPFEGGGVEDCGSKKKNKDA